MNKNPFRILHLEDDASSAKMIHDLLRQVALDCEIEVVNSGELFRSSLKTRRFDLILADCRLTFSERWSSLVFAQRNASSIPFILISDSMSEEHAIDGLQRGAWDYVLKSNLRALPFVILRGRDYFRERELRQAEENVRRHRALLDLCNEAIMVRDSFDTIVYWNEGAERLYGWRREEAIGKRSQQLLSSSSPHVAWAEIANECSKTGHWEGELIRHHRNGDKVTVASRWTSRPHTNPALVEIVEIDTDKAPIKRAEEQFYQAQKLQTLGALAGGMAHNFNNILTAFQSVLSILKLPGRRTEETSMLFSILESSVESGTALVKQIALLANNREDRITEINLKHQIEAFLSTIEQTFLKGIVTETDCEEDLPKIRADESKINQVLLNLCLNSRDAMPETGGAITISTGTISPHEIPREMDGVRAQDYVRITIGDNGCGMSDAKRAQILEPFFTPRAVEPGAGLGLAAVYGILRDYEGFVTVESEVGVGTSFSVYLPALIAKTSRTETVQHNGLVSSAM